ncbi:RNA methyltransferase [Aquimarina sp. RZ0]|uniref:RNA methyltransferase n=1 Tax=Aquimarina sp. RZ0 TaxID=2607730 RepID=UPI0034CDE16E
MFVAEGKKVINELLEADFKLYSLFTMDTSLFVTPDAITFKITEDELKNISFLTTAQVALAIFYIPENESIEADGLTLILDDVRDPGNLGTIIRLCDWFGIQNLVCSEQTVDCYNPKVVQATMGSITRVRIEYTDLINFLSLKSVETPVYGTFMNGNNIHKEELPKKAVIVMGNEANGISTAVKNLITQTITIPQFGESAEAESLNVATATAIVLNEFKRMS